jgi:hypothetical protein
MNKTITTVVVVVVVSGADFIIDKPLTIDEYGIIAGAPPASTSSSACACWGCIDLDFTIIISFELKFKFDAVGVEERKKPAAAAAAAAAAPPDDDDADDNNGLLLVSTSTW